MNKILIATILLGLFLIVAGPVKASFGVSPAGLTFDYLIPGMSVEKEFTISRTDTDQNVNISVEPNTEEINDWIGVEPGSSFMIAKGERTKKMKVIINVPENAEYKDYEGYLLVKNANEGQSSGVDIVKGVGITINMTVTRSEVSELFIRKMEIPDVSETNPIKVILTTENYGNILTKPERLIISVEDTSGNELFQAEDNEIESIEPSKIKDVTVSFDHDLGLGEYKAKIAVYFEGKVIKEGDLVFYVRDVEPEKVVENKVNDIIELLKIVLLSIMPISAIWFTIKRRYKNEN